MKLWAKQKGFTIVELLIVIVVIAILAAITIVTFSGLQGRGKDSRRTSEIGSIQKLLELYHADNGGYPMCGSNTAYVPPETNNTYNSVSNCLTSSLVPKYTSSLPVDPVNSGSNIYFYAVGYQKIGGTNYTNNHTDNYIIATKLDTVASPTFSGWSRTDLTYLVGSSN